MKHVFIAVGGSGTKVAEALVKLIGIGFPTRVNDRDTLTSVGDTLEIWRVDPDRSSGAATDLNETLAEYSSLQNSLSEDGERLSFSGSRWAMEIDTTVKDLNPLDLPKVNERDNQVKTLRGILNSRYNRSLEDSLPLLYPFYEDKDLDVAIDEGFYQKPFIGSAIMAIFAQSMEQSAVAAETDAWIRAFHNTPTNFFLCGSLHGGTGASGVPVMAQFLNRRKADNPDWRIGGCMLTPYFRPPDPPFQKLEGEIITQENLEQKTTEYYNQYKTNSAFDGADPDFAKKIVRLILQGYYAKPDEIIPRAKQGLDYYRRYASSYFDEMYLVGKPSPSQLVNWSNGGRSQRNPLNSTEVVAAISALNYFARNNTEENSDYILASSASHIEPDKMRIADLPTYRIGRDIEPEKVFLSTALLYQFLSHQLPWEKVHEAADKFAIFSQFKNMTGRAERDQLKYDEALSCIRRFLVSLVRPNERTDPTGWSEDDSREIRMFFEKRMEKTMGIFTREAKPTILGKSSVPESLFKEFPSWCPAGNFTRGEYLRDVWAHIFPMCQSRRIS